MREGTFWVKMSRGATGQLKSAGVSGSSVSVLMEMLTYWKRREGSMIFVSRETLAEATELSVRTVTRAFAAFESSGLLEVVGETGNGRGCAKVWQVTQKLADILGVKIAPMPDPDLPPEGV